MNVLVLASWYPNKELPTNGNFVAHYAQIINKVHRVFVLHAVGHQSVNYKIDIQLVNGVEQCVVYYPKITNSFLFLKKYNRLNKAYELGFNALLKEFNVHFDLLHLHVILRTGIPALKIKEKIQVPLLITEHSTRFFKSNRQSFSFWERKYIQFVLKRADGLISVSNDLEKAIESGYKIPDKNWTVDNPVQHFFCEPIEEKKNKTIVFTHISNGNEEHKNCSAIIESFSKLKGNIALQFIGFNPTEEQKELCEKLNCEAKINWFGNLPPKEVAKYLRKSDALVLFSRYETFSIVVAEAWCCGVPVISPKVGGLTNEITNENGIVVSNYSVEELYKSMQEFVYGFSSFNRFKITEIAQKRFQELEILKKHNTIYNTILK